jgi:hypothetical protein
MWCSARRSLPRAFHGSYHDAQVVVGFGLDACGL